MFYNAAEEASSVAIEFMAWDRDGNSGQGMAFSPPTLILPCMESCGGGS
jgi:hypothetical protein